MRSSRGAPLVSRRRRDPKRLGRFLSRLASSPRSRKQTSRRSKTSRSRPGAPRGSRGPARAVVVAQVVAAKTTTTKRSKVEVERFLISKSLSSSSSSSSLILPASQAGVAAGGLFSTAGARRGFRDGSERPRLRARRRTAPGRAPPCSGSMVHSRVSVFVVVVVAIERVHLPRRRRPSSSVATRPSSKPPVCLSFAADTLKRRREAEKEIARAEETK